MKTLRAVNSLSEFEELVDEVGSLVPLSVASVFLGLHVSRAYQLAESGRIRVFGVMGVYQTPIEDIKRRLESQRSGRVN